MASDASSLSDEQFLEIAVNQRLLTPEEADQAGRAAADTNMSLPALCIEKGVLRPVQVDVIHGLADPELAPGYTADDLLGYGGLGIVYRARQPELDRMIALKTIPMQRIENPSVIARFKQEAKAIGKLKHPNIVAAYDFGTHRDRLYLAMELVEGIDLDDLIKKEGQLSESVAWALAQQAAAGLAAAAQHSLVHRDIKPGNLLLTKPPAGYPLPPGVPLLKITDFGLVQLEQPDMDQTRLTLGGTSLGTPHYMAPEQVADAHVDSRADIYALGATVFHMITGIPPFDGKTVGQVLAAKLKGNQDWVNKLPETTSQATTQLLKEMLAEDPEDRLADYSELLDRIKSILTGQPMTATADHETVTGLLSADTSLDLLLVEPDSIGRFGRRTWLKVGALVVAVALGGALHFSSSQRGPANIPASSLMPSGWERPLFNGQSLKGWKTTAGSWYPTADDMGGRVMSGKNGSIDHELPTYTSSPNEPLAYFGVRLKVDLKTAEVAELHFEHEDIQNDDLPRSVVRLTDAGAALGSKSGKRAEFQANTDDFPTTSLDEDSHYHELRLERHEQHWLVLLDGREICFQPIDLTHPTTAIQLLVEGGQAFFADLFVFELVPK